MAQIILNLMVERSRLHIILLWEPGLPVMVAGQPTTVLNVRALSRASPLPQVLCTFRNSDENPHEKR
ncbi:conserved hypothetical protein [Pseudomonas sp. IT-P100]